MKTVKLTPREFALFQMLANEIQMLFMYTVSQGYVFVEADKYELETLGY